MLQHEIDHLNGTTILDHASSLKRPSTTGNSGSGAGGISELRVVFMGTPEFSVPTLVALRSNFHVAGVVTQPDRPRGRGLKTIPTAVKKMAGN